MDRIGILLVSHNSASTGILSTVEMILGKQEDIRALELQAEDSPEELQKEMQSFVQEYKGNCVVLVDVFGGTPFNTTIKMAKTMEVHAVTGMNVPMVIGALESRDGIKPDVLIKKMIETGKTGITNMDEIINKLLKKEE